MEELGFSLEHEWSLDPPPESEGFVNKTFVFTRTGVRANAPGDVEDVAS
jgi:hypothetical protein